MNIGSESNANARKNGAAEQPFVLNFDCGDGVPALQTLPRSDVERDGPRPRGQLPSVGPRTFGLGATLGGQLLVALAVAAGGSPVVGIAAAVVLAAGGLAIVLTPAINRKLNRSANRRP